MWRNVERTPRRSTVLAGLLVLGIVLAPAGLHAATEPKNEGSEIVGKGVETARQNIDGTQLPFQRFLVFQIPVGKEFESSQFTVPSDQRLVIEFPSVIATLPAGQSIIFFTIRTSVSGTDAFHRLAPDWGRAQTFTASETTKIYADPGTEVTVSARRQGTSGTGNVNFSISGFTEFQ